jgi:hypothetical protein
MRRALASLLALALALVGATTALAIPWDRAGSIPPSKTARPDRPDPLCQQSYAKDRPRAGRAIRFGIGPRLAGEGGTRQTVPVTKEIPAKRDAALRRLKGRKFLAVRLNRLFMADGNEGIARFRRLANRFARLGLEVELQVRYHPRAEDDGNIAKWLQYVRRVVRAFGPNKAVTGLQITNEVNIGVSPNTSDGAYRNAVEALVRGVVTAKRTSRALGYRHQRIGFNYAWRFGDATDAAFWDRLRAQGGRTLRRHTDWVGLDIYPGTFIPPQPVVADLGDAFLEGVAQMRECYMRKAGFKRSVPLRIEETGWPTGPGRSEAAQRSAVSALVKAAHRYRGTYNISDFRWFGLRDNNSRGPNFQSFFGLLRDDYSAKPGFHTYRRLIARYGARR